MEINKEEGKIILQALEVLPLPFRSDEMVRLSFKVEKYVGELNREERDELRRAAKLD